MARSDLLIKLARAGNVKTIDRATLLLQKEIIHWKLQRGVAKFLPKHTELFRLDDDAAAA